MTPHSNASCRIYDPPQSHVKPCFQLAAPPVRMRLASLHTGHPHLLGWGTAHRVASVLGGAWCLCFLPSTVISVLRAWARGATCSQGQTAVLGWKASLTTTLCSAGLWALPELGDHLAPCPSPGAGGPAVPRLGSGRRPRGRAGPQTAACSGKAGTCGGRLLLVGQVPGGRGSGSYTECIWRGSVSKIYEYTHQSLRYWMIL